MILPPIEKLDLDRLHAVIKRIEEQDPYLPYARAAGQTVARLFLMIGEVELGDNDNNYLYVGEDGPFTKWVAREFMTMLEWVFPERVHSHTLKDVNSPNLIILRNGQRYRFLSVDTLYNDQHMLRAHKFDKIFFDVSAYKRDFLNFQQYKRMIDLLRLTDAIFV